MRRNKILVPVALGLTLTVTAACGGGASDSGADTLTFVSWGSAFQDNQQKAWQEPYTKKTGTTFRNDGPSDTAKLKAMVEAGNVSWDVLDMSTTEAEQYCGKYVEKLDFSAIDKDAYPEGSVSDCGVPAYFYGLHFMYNTETYGDNPPTKIADFFDLERFPGQRLLPPEVSVGMLEDALLADGVSVEQLYPLDVDRALAKLDTIKRVSTFAESYGQMQQVMVDGQADMTLVVTARAYSSLSAGAKFKPVWDKTVLTWDSLVIPKGSPNSDAAMNFIAFTAQPAQSAKFSELSTVLPAHKDAKPSFNSRQAELNPMTPEREAGTVLSNFEWWSQNNEAVTAQYVAWLAG